MVALPEMVMPEYDVEISKATLTYFDGSSREVFFTDEEYIVSKSMMIVSRTDTSGRITHVNTDFLEASGYSEAEVLHQPHFILRHPHMPKAAFQELWNTVKNGDIWSGAVKNLRKNGGYYWVQAVVKPLNDADGRIIGFHSVRKRLDRVKINEFESTYEAMRTTEA